MKKILISLIAFALVMPMQAQFLNRLVHSAGRAAENAIESNVEKKVEEGVDKAFNPEEEEEPQEQEQKQVKSQKQQGWTCPACGAKGQTGKFCTECGAKKPEGDGSWTCPACGAKGQKGKFCTECGAKKPEAGGAKAAQPAAAQPEKKVAESAYAKSDFVRGDEVFFDDDFASEQMGEFPSKWDLNEGSVEVASLNGQKYLLGTEWSYNVEPLMKNQKSWLPDQFTLEFDLYISNEEEVGSAIWHLYLVSNKSNWNDLVGDIDFWWRPDDEGVILRYGSMRKPDNENTVDGEEEALVRKSMKINDWNHFALSFNKRALKFYLNGTRIFQVPNMMAPEKIQFYCEGDYKYRGYANVVLAKGAVPLYNRLATEGRIITYGITFDIGKATIKPQSMTEINRIYELMNQNADLKFEVQGHTDNTGNAALNQKLSEQRAQAIVAKLVEMGISANRLTAVGKGQSSPIADNGTDEGRAKNRRVEFIKK
jgi:outer membrane protein OmpA-like peptidoglycan-associated protein